jgi:hypothetical protein
MTELKDLPDIRNFLYDKAELMWWFSLGLSLGVPFCSLLILLTNVSWLQVSMGFIAMLSPFGVVWLREIAANFSQQADKCRRLILYADGLGYQISPNEQMIVKSCVKEANVKSAVFKAPYYTSAYEPGPHRLVDVVKESAYFTHQLAQEVASLLSKILIISGIILLMVLYFGLPVLEKSKDLPLVAKSATIIISFLYAGDIFWLWKKFSGFHIKAEKIFYECAMMLKQKDLKVRDSFQLVEEYHLLINHNPPIPKYLYFKNMDRLNKIYRDCQLRKGEISG